MSPHVSVVPGGISDENSGGSKDRSIDSLGFCNVAPLQMSHGAVWPKISVVIQAFATRKIVSFAFITMAVVVVLITLTSQAAELTGALIMNRKKEV